MSEAKIIMERRATTWGGEVEENGLKYEKREQRGD
jgi:hypothetical protein